MKGQQDGGGQVDTTYWDDLQGLTNLVTPITERDEVRKRGLLGWRTR